MWSCKYRQRLAITQTNNKLADFSRTAVNSVVGDDKESQFLPCCVNFSLKAYGFEGIGNHYGRTLTQGMLMLRKSCGSLVCLASKKVKGNLTAVLNCHKNTEDKTGLRSVQIQDERHIACVK